MKKLFIDVASKNVSVFVLEDNLLVEYHIETSKDTIRVGDIYLGRVNKILSSVNAAFINIGEKKDGFLHLSKSGPHTESWKNLIQKAKKKYLGNNINLYRIDKQNKAETQISEALKTNEYIPVQVVKEPISKKGVKLSTDIAIPGKYMVLVPFSQGVFISKSIKNTAEIKRLKSLIKDILPNNFAAIIRTKSKNISIKKIKADLKELYEKWEQLIRTIPPDLKPKILLKEENKVNTIIRDLLNEDFQTVYVNDKDLVEKVKDITQGFEQKKCSVVFYENKEKLFGQYQIDKQVKSAFIKRVPLPGGGSLIIEHTEAMHVIDVNSGSMNQENENQQELALKTNLEATKEILRQLRLRDLGGIIVIDYIDLVKKEDRDNLYQTLKKQLKLDRAKSMVLPPSKIGLVQITRQRTGPATTLDFDEKCPVCKGNGKINHSISLADEVEKNVDYFCTQKKYKNIAIELHPLLWTYFTNGFPSKRLKWRFKYKQAIKLVANKDFHLSQYQFSTKKDGILLQYK